MILRDCNRGVIVAVAQEDSVDQWRGQVGHIIGVRKVATYDYAVEVELGYNPLLPEIDPLTGVKNPENKRLVICVHPKYLTRDF